MRTPVGRIRNVMYLMVALMISVALAACGGSGGGSTSSTSPGVSGPATVSVSIASAPSFPAGTTFATSTSSPATAAAPANSPDFEHVWVTVTKLALIPSTGSEFPDPNGESEMPNSSAEEGTSGMSGFATTSFDPVQIDLLHPPAGDNVNVAALLDKFSEVQAGEYSKIRVYYDNVVGQSGTDNTLFHPTAHYHFDVHFVGGNLVIPESTDNGVRFYSVVIKLVGLKYHLAGQSGNVLLRPQVFATVDNSSLEYIVTGIADNVTKSTLAGTFDIHALGGRTIPAAFYNTDTGTYWAYSDNVLEDSPWVIARDKEIAVPAFENGAIVSAIGVFDTDGRLQASQITFSFPDVRQGTADNVWILGDTAFTVESLTDNDNVTVFPMPDRLGAYYDNSTSQLTFAAIDNNIQVKVRGYFNTYPNLDAYWISVEDTIVP